MKKSKLFSILVWALAISFVCVVAGLLSNLPAATPFPYIITPGGSGSNVTLISPTLVNPTVSGSPNFIGGVNVSFATNAHFATSAGAAATATNAPDGYRVASTNSVLNGAKLQSGTVNSNALDTATAAQLALAGSGGGADRVLTNNGTSFGQTLVAPSVAGAGTNAELSVTVSTSVTFLQNTNEIWAWFDNATSPAGGQYVLDIYEPKTDLDPTGLLIRWTNVLHPEFMVWYVFATYDTPYIPDGPGSWGMTVGPTNSPAQIETGQYLTVRNIPGQGNTWSGTFSNTLTSISYGSNSLTTVVTPVLNSTLNLASPYGSLAQGNYASNQLARAAINGSVFSPDTLHLLWQTFNSCSAADEFEFVAEAGFPTAVGYSPDVSVYPRQQRGDFTFYFPALFNRVSTDQLYNHIKLLVDYEFPEFLGFDGNVSLRTTGMVPGVLRLAYAHFRATGAPTAFTNYLTQITNGIGQLFTLTNGMCWSAASEAYEFHTDSASQMPVAGYNSAKTLLYWDYLGKMGEMAAAAGMTAVATNYAHVRSNIVVALEANLWDGEAGLYKALSTTNWHSVIASASAVHFGACSKGVHDAIVSNFVADIGVGNLFKHGSSKIIKENTGDAYNGYYYPAFAGYVISTLSESNIALADNELREFAERCVRNGPEEYFSGEAGNPGATYLLSVARPLSLLMAEPPRMNGRGKWAP